MRVGMAPVFQSPGRVRHDFDVCPDNLRLADPYDPIAPGPA